MLEKNVFAISSNLQLKLLLLFSSESRTYIVFNGLRYLLFLSGGSFCDLPWGEVSQTNYCCVVTSWQFVKSFAHGKDASNENRCALTPARMRGYKQAHIRIYAVFACVYLIVLCGCLGVWVCRWNLERRLLNVVFFFGWLGLNGLTHFWSMFPFETPWKHQKTLGFLVFSGGIK